MASASRERTAVAAGEGEGAPDTGGAHLVLGAACELARRRYVKSQWYWYWGAAWHCNGTGAG